MGIGGLDAVFRPFLCRDSLEAEAVMVTDFWFVDNEEEEEEVDTGDASRLVPLKYHGMNLEHNVAQEGRAKVQNLALHKPDNVRSIASTFDADLVGMRPHLLPIRRGIAVE